jgi:hypothetical protein
VYQMFDIELGSLPSYEFDRVLGEKLIDMFGSAESVQLGIKNKYLTQYGDTGSHNNPSIVTSGILHVYKQHINEERCPVGPIPFQV